MPLLRIQTNHKINAETRSGLLREASAMVAQILGKPERYVMLSLEFNPDMLFAGEDGPLAYLELKSVGLPSERTDEISAALCSMMEDTLDIPRERVYIEFADAERNLWGWNGGTL